jgi:hypothetical protein
MDIDPKTYPSRAFARFTARTQLLSDAAGRPIVSSVQRLGGQAYVQKAVPDGEAPTISQDPGGSATGLRLGFSISPFNRGNTPIGSNQAWDAACAPNGDTNLEPQDTSQRTGIDDALFEEVAKTALNPNRFPDLYQSCGSQQAAMEVEALVAAEIVAAYRRIKANQDSLIVQNLNQLL